MRRIVVVGAGCFGAWTAYHLARLGRDVTLLDAHGPASSRASSGGHTRLIRMGYGAEEIYTRWSLESLAQWKALAERTSSQLFHQIGVMWMARGHDALAAATLATLGRAGVPHERLTRAQLESRWPQIDFRPAEGERPEPAEPADWAILEPESGVLMARRAVRALVDELVGGGVRYAPGAVRRPGGERGSLESIETISGETYRGAAFVFACGPWLPALFPDLVGDRIFTTRQEVLYFGCPPGDVRFASPALPAWIDFAAEIYGVPDIAARGFKISVDRHGAPFDPETGNRVAGETLPAARAYLARRFPALANAPLVSAEVCQYENTCNGDFLIDRHPDHENVWLVGGGSGHGFKHGPAVGEYAARLIVDDPVPDERFRLTTKATVQQRSVY
jgi:glycine/D-amino acid oxidase-like deaminating enzyme